VEPHLTLTRRIAKSARRMNHMVGDLLDLTRTRLGNGIPIARAEMDLAKEAANAVDEIRGAHPKSVLQLDTSGELKGSWDCARISQVLSNLLANAVQHGTAGAMISVTLRGEATEVVLEVHNTGPRIPDADRAGLFDPLKRVANRGGGGARESLGLGLYIAERIVSAHGGTITLESTDAGTSFTVHLPR
jgi:signal transduction histidine kinase